MSSFCLYAKFNLFPEWLSINLKQQFMVAIWHLHSVTGHNKKLKLILIRRCFFNAFRTAKPTANGNHRLCLKLKPQVKCHWSFPAGKTLEGEARGLSSRLWTYPKSSPTVRKGLSPGQKGPINSPLRSAKAAKNGNHGPCPKSKPQVKCH